MPENSILPLRSLFEGREYLHERLQRFGLVGALLAAVFGSITGITLLLEETGVEQSAPLTVAGMLVPIVVFLGLVVLCRSVLPATQKRWKLYTIDLGICLVACVGYCLAGWGLLRFPFAMVPCSFTILFRSVVVPTVGRWSALVAAVSLLPLVLLYCLQSHWIGDPAAAPNTSVVFGFKCVLIVVTAGAISRVIFRLRREARVGQTLGPYVIEATIGRGAMGQVFKARHQYLRRPTAVKLCQPSDDVDHGYERFEREVRLTSELSHPNTVAVYDYGKTTDGLYYYAMEYLPGWDLKEVVRRSGPLPAARVVHILRQACGSLNEAHGRGLIHRDIKPQNLILCERGGIHDVVKVVDFGLAKDLQSKAQVALTNPGVILGTPGYWAPEIIAHADNIDGRCDLYALGAVGFFLITGTELFRGADYIEMAMHHLNTPPARPRHRLGTAVPEDLEQVLLRALCKEPSERQTDAAAFQAELDACRDAGKWSAADALEWWTKQRP